MKRLLLLALPALLSFASHAQDHLYRVDSAKMVLDRYHALLNYDIISNDSSLYIESIIVSPQVPGDTTRMRRWFTMPNYYRTEVWHNDTLQEAYFGDGYLHFRQYNKATGLWNDMPPDNYYDALESYDFHGPLHNWQSRGVEITFAGTWDFNGNEVYRLHVKDPMRYYRYYLFEKESGLLFYIDETDEMAEDHKAIDSVRVLWRAYNEYIPLGKQLYISTESYMQENKILTIIYHRPRYLKRDMAPYYVDRYKEKNAQ